MYIMTKDLYFCEILSLFLAIWSLYKLLYDSDYMMMHIDCFWDIIDSLS